MTYRYPVDSLPAARLAANLNSLLRRQQSLEQAERAIRGSDVAHHVVDPQNLLGIDPLQATPLDDALPALAAAETEAWFLALPTPGALAPLRGPAPFNRAALEQGQAVVASSAGLGLVPHRVGRAVQWQIHAAERPFAPSSPYDAERALNEAVIVAAAVLSRLEVAAGARPADPLLPVLAPGYASRQQVTAQRAARLLAACELALRDDGGSLSAYEADRRARELRTVRTHAAEALSAAVSWMR